ncbi:MAG: hypothetical protein GX627_00555 [Parcubacteria group bacterium]|mgnify:CR=1 FL=1|nr:hypothetical protein [Parcubacteria group bacterium]
MSEVYERDSFFWAYVKWHYTQGLRELFGVAYNFLWFIAHFFSFKLLLKTLFVPWKKFSEHCGKKLNPGSFSSGFIINGLTRTAGFIVKVAVLTVGFVAYVLVSVLTFIVFIIWVLAPVILLGCIVLAITFFVA